MRISQSLLDETYGVKAFVWSVALYGSKTWTSQKRTFVDLNHLKYGYGGV